LTGLAGSETGQPDFETAQPQARRTASGDAAPFKWVGGAVSKEVIMKRINALLAAAAMAVSATAVAAPAPVPAARSVAVDTGDLDLGTDKGQRILALRIQRAARAMCKAEALDSLPRNLRKQRGCISQARARAKAAADILTAARQAPSRLGG
jgi:UrcA family protein